MKRIICALCIGFFCILALNLDFEATEAALANSVIRLHVLANSDSKEDQALKLKVRDRIIAEMEHMFDSSGDIDAARETVEQNIEAIREIAADEIQKNGYNYDVSVDLGMSEFPTKEYGSIVLPAGSYEALKINIGNAKGKNWWCVLFPPLCFVEETCVQGDTELVSGLSDSTKEFVKKDKSGSTELRFKAYELWQKGKQKLTAFAKIFTT